MLKKVQSSRVSCTDSRCPLNVILFLFSLLFWKTSSMDRYPGGHRVCPELSQGREHCMDSVAIGNLLVPSVSDSLVDKCQD